MVLLAAGLTGAWAAHSLAFVTSGELPAIVRHTWVTETALSTALSTAYFAESTATFVIVMGIALLLTGIGFLVLTLRVPYQPGAVKHSRQPTAAVAVPH